MRCKDGLVLLTREMSRWLGLVPRETPGCVSTHYWVVPFTEVYSGYVKMVWFYLLGSRLNVCRHMSRRCLLQRFTREMSRLFGFSSSGDTWFWILGRCQDGLVSVSRETFGCVSTHV